MDTTEMTNKLEEMPATMDRLQEAAKHKLSDVSHKVADVSQKVAERSRVAATTTDAYVREYAWSSVALAALMGIIIGLMLRRP